MGIGPRPDEEPFGEASLGAAQSSNPPDDPDMIDPTADPLDTDVEDADLFLRWDDASQSDGSTRRHPGRAAACPVPHGRCVNGTAVALAQEGDELFYLVDAAALDRRPLWVREGEVETCRVATGGT